MTNGTKKPIQTLIPSVDIIEKQNSYIVTLDIPGAAKDKITAQIEDGMLNVLASVLEKNEAEATKEYRRAFSLANDVDVNTIDAQYDNGVLRITLNKKIQYLPKEIIIN